MVARAGFEPTTLRLRVIDVTNATPRPTNFKLSSLTGYGHASAVPRCLEEWGIGNRGGLGCPKRPGKMSKTALNLM